ncbi:bifunctional isocitrate dehydrogenase kinase/phosphatase [Aliidiomarina sedimenti]|uniref:Isocitrate dehydrogenase kinase/phosphatase n=1 Tax=Aliidiomarina sedimenti TaxID=1933879 RepID=A0ABY0BUR6_9GAMM|nr:bifunctional isocitrate dehydrogenase kinase/phosphatase [Aliidiomarina sedimenti]RUO28022.1 bifunctional isocitrate dehydrogenase kinase/phosphatase [Aliidiomarina sedimenti]
MAQANRIARLILQGFQRHYRIFGELTDDAGQRFQQGDWLGLQHLSRERISYYDERVAECVGELTTQLPSGSPDSELWQQVKQDYIGLLSFHPQAELAETFFNSVFCKLFHRRYFHNQFIFVETTIEGRIPVPVEAEYRSYFPVEHGVPETLLQIIQDIGFAAPFADLKEDVERLRRAFSEQTRQHNLQAHQLRLDVLKHPFYRNKAAYVIGRIVTTERSYPFIVPVLRGNDGHLLVDALLTDPQHLSVIFSFARAYFMVRAQAPSALVRFLQSLLPRKSKADLYSAIGLHKQGKTEFYRELLLHLQRSDDQMVAAPGIRGLVMMVFTLPSFPYVFKVIRDRFGSTKEFGRDTVVARYQLVKRHDRVGRMADTIEYSDVALPLNRISADLLAELESSIGESMKIEGDTLIIRHLYIEKRLTPLNIYLEYADEEETRAILDDYGRALKDMLAANIFPGDMLLKNFGVTRGRRVVFYDYDEVQYLTSMNFRAMPKAKDQQDLLMDSESVSVGPHDVFPQQLATYVFAKPKLRAIFTEQHPDLLEAEYWQSLQSSIRQGEVADIFPYPSQLRFPRYKSGE